MWVSTLIFVHSITYPVNATNVCGKWNYENNHRIFHMTRNLQTFLAKDSIQ
jgi:hypothetical protein